MQSAREATSSSEVQEKAVTEVVVTVRTRGWKCQKNPRALHVQLGRWELGNTQAPRPQGGEGMAWTREGLPLGTGPWHL